MIEINNSKTKLKGSKNLIDILVLTENKNLIIRFQQRFLMTNLQKCLHCQ